VHVPVAGRFAVALDCIAPRTGDSAWADRPGLPHRLADVLVQRCPQRGRARPFRAAVTWPAMPSRPRFPVSPVTGQSGEDIALQGDLRAVALMNLRTVEASPGLADAERRPAKLTPARMSGCWCTL
jgi:hypothetical protein